MKRYLILVFCLLMTGNAWADVKCSPRNPRTGDRYCCDYENGHRTNCRISWNWGNSNIPGEFDDVQCERIKKGPPYSRLDEQLCCHYSEGQRTDDCYIY